MLAENVNRASAGLQGEALGHQKMALESTLRLHDDGARANGPARNHWRKPLSENGQFGLVLVRQLV